MIYKQPATISLNSSVSCPSPGDIWSVLPRSILERAKFDIRKNIKWILLRFSHRQDCILLFLFPLADCHRGLHKQVQALELILVPIWRGRHHLRQPILNIFLLATIPYKYEISQQFWKCSHAICVMLINNKIKRLPI